jgi:2-keto-4-pentenoate hydratase/2-oxohepta-3-ene-1,7-dioic acid hydratase in catechol pathway
MRIVRYLDPSGQTRYGHLAPDDSVLELDGDILGPHLATPRPAQVAKLLAPIAPRAIICIGLNYRAHAAETNAQLPQWPVVFMKLPAATQNPDDPVILPQTLESTQVDFEGELVVVIGRTAKNVRRSEALHYVLGYTCGNDISARDWQRQWGGGQYCRGKTFDTFAPIGPCITTTDEIPDPSRLQLTTHVSGELMQSSSTGDLIFDVPYLIEFLSGSTTLEAGTLIFTGTPSGVGMARKPPRWLRPGDSMAVSISGIGTLRNRVTLEHS